MLTEHDPSCCSGPCAYCDEQDRIRRTRIDKIRHRFNVWIDVPAKSGDSWSKYPDYSAEEVGRMLRRALHDRLEFDAEVEHADTTQVKE